MVLCAAGPSLLLILYNNTFRPKIKMILIIINSLCNLFFCFIFIPIFQGNSYLFWIFVFNRYSKFASNEFGFRNPCTFVNYNLKAVVSAHVNKGLTIYVFLVVFSVF